MTRFFLTGANLLKGVAVLHGEDAEHVRVLRMKIGEKIIICDGEGRDHICGVTCIDDKAVYAERVETVPNTSEPGVSCVVLAAMPKGDRADFIVQKCTEAGAHEISFFFSERCVSRPDGKSLEKKLARWHRIAREAAQQSGRGIIPKVGFAGNIAAAIEAALKTELPLIMYETGERVPLKAALTDAGAFSSCAVVTGPEGGFEEHEAALCRAAGLKVCSMGPRILRCETAPLCALTAIMFHTGNLD